MIGKAVHPPVAVYWQWLEQEKEKQGKGVPHDPKQHHPHFDLSSWSSSDLILLDPFKDGQELSNLYPILKKALIEQTRDNFPFNIQYTPQTLRLVKMVEKEKQPKQEKEEEEEIKARMQKEDTLTTNNNNHNNDDKNNNTPTNSAPRMTATTTTTTKLLGVLPKSLMIRIIIQTVIC